MQRPKWRVYTSASKSDCAVLARVYVVDGSSTNEVIYDSALVDADDCLALAVQLLIQREALMRRSGRSSSADDGLITLEVDPDRGTHKVQKSRFGFLPPVRTGRG
jgi:hypothetical protein